MNKIVLAPKFHITQKAEHLSVARYGSRKPDTPILFRWAISLLLTIILSLQSRTALVQPLEPIIEFDQEDIVTEFEQVTKHKGYEDQESGFDEYQEDGVDFSSFDNEKEETKQSLLSSIFPPTRITLLHEFFLKVKQPTDMRCNRSSVRLEYSRALGEYFFILLDIKQKFFWKNDHQAQAKEKELYTDFSPREIFLQGSFADTSIKAGRQILIWGESEGGAITDVISPRDFKETFFVSLEESRIGQSMVLLDQFSPIGDFSLFFIPHAKFNAYPDKGSAYYTDTIGENVITEDDPKKSNDHEFGCRWKKTFGQSDVAVMAARLVENDYIYHFSGKNKSGEILLSRGKEHFSMAGITFNYGSGSFLFKGEAGYKSPLHFNTEDFYVKNKDVLDTAIGFEYSPGDAYTLSVELVNRHIRDWQDGTIMVPENDSSIVFVWEKEFFNELLSVNWMSIANLTNNGFIHILKTSYDWDDHLTLKFEAYYPDINDKENFYWHHREEKQVALKIQYTL